MLGGGVVVQVVRGLRAQLCRHRLVVFVGVGFGQQLLGQCERLGFVVVLLVRLEQLAQLSKLKKVVAIGETGLDYHWDIPKDLQKRVFEEQIRLSLDLEMPLIVHDREAHGDVYDLLRKYKPNALVHCFSGSVELMREAVRMGMYISLGGVVTFKNARHSLEVASEIPLDRLLLETDAPYMAPVPFRGKRCDSSMIVYAAEKIASLRNMSISELLQITCDNAKRFYNIDD